MTDRLSRRLLFALVLVPAGAALVGGGVLLVRSASGIVVQPGTPIQLAGDNTFALVRAQNSPSLVADPLDANRLAAAVRVDRPDFNCSAYSSNDRGRSWRAAQLSIPASASGCYSPVLAFSSTGDLFMAFLGLSRDTGGTVGTYLARSTDGGQSFAPATRVGPADTLQPRLLVIGQDVRVAWLDAGPADARPLLGLSSTRDNPLLMVTSHDAGATFAPPTRINAASRRRVGAAQLAALGDRILVTYVDYRDDAGDYEGSSTALSTAAEQIVVAESTDGGASFHELAVAEPQMRPAAVLPVYLPPTPSLVADGDRNQLDLAWEDGSVPGGAILFRRSSDGGRTWDRPLRLDAGSGTAHRLPSLGVVPGGRIDCVFYTIDGAAHPEATTVGYAVSTDAGAGFQPEIDILANAFDPETGPMEPRSHHGDLGDRLAIVSQPDWTVAAWSESRSGGDIQRQNVVILSLDVHSRGLHL